MGTYYKSNYFFWIKVQTRDCSVLLVIKAHNMPKLKHNLKGKKCLLRGKPRLVNKINIKQVMKNQNKKNG